MPIRTPKGTVYPDFFWREQGLIGEVDGAEKYRNPVAGVQEKEREQVLRDMNFRMVRWLGREIRLTPWVVVDRVARELAA